MNNIELASMNNVELTIMNDVELTIMNKAKLNTAPMSRKPNNFLILTF